MPEQARISAADTMHHINETADFNQALAISAASGFLNAMTTEPHDIAHTADPGMSVDVHQIQDPAMSQVETWHQQDPGIAHPLEAAQEAVPDLHHY